MDCLKMKLVSFYINHILVVVLKKYKSTLFQSYLKKFRTTNIKI